MYKYKISTTLPFWAKNNDNKPNLNVFNDWISKNMVENNNIIINFIDLQNITINSEFNGIKYIEVKNENDINDTRYYYIDSTATVGANNTFTFNAVLDIYASYTLKFLLENQDTELVFLRKHEYDKKALQIDDSNFAAIPKLYKNFYFKKVQFNYDEENKIWYGEKLGLKSADLLNANKYYVFQDGPEGGYKFFPICTKALNATLYYQEKVKGELIFAGEFWNGRYNDELRVEIPPAVNNAVVQAYENNDIIEYKCKHMEYGYVFPAHTVWLTGWRTIYNVPYGVLPIDINAYNTSGNNAGAGLKYIDYTILMLGNQVFHHKSWNITASKHGDIGKVGRGGRQFRVEIYKNKPISKIKQIKNSITGLEEYRKREQNIQKFLGIFYMPHLFNFNNYQFEGDYLYVTIKPTGDTITLFNIFDYNLSNITDKLNNSTYSTPYFLRYLNIKYYGNFINAEYRVNKMNSIFIGGKLFFTDTCNIISKSDNLISLENSIISFPYQLPIGVDTYEQYVKANRGVTDTGFAIERQKNDLNLAKTLTGGALGAVSGIAQAFTGDSVGGVSKTLGAGMNVGFGIASQIQGMQQLEQKTRAQYEQANMKLGNQIQFSNINNAALSIYYDSTDGSQFEGVEISDLDDSSLIQMNNYIYFNGYLNPQKDTVKNRMNPQRIFNYLKIDAELLFNLINIKYNKLVFNNETYNLVFNQLTSGVRIWNQNIDDVQLPEYDDNEQWPDQPSDVRPPIAPPPPPEQPQNIINVENLVLGAPLQYLNEHGEINSKKSAFLLEWKAPYTDVPFPHFALVSNQQVEDPIIVVPIIDNGIKTLTINITGSTTAEYDKFDTLINNNADASYILDELIININDQTTYEKMNALKPFTPTGKLAGWVEDSLKNISVKTIKINKVG